MKNHSLTSGGYFKKHQTTADVNGLKGQLGQQPVWLNSQTE
jgi:hypothetical protein